MFGLNKSMMDLVLGQVKTKIQSAGIKHMSVKCLESGELAVRGFKENMYVISDKILEEIRKVEPKLYDVILKINNPEETEDKTKGE